MMRLVAVLLLLSTSAIAEQASPQQVLEQRVSALVAADLGRCRIDIATATATIEFLQKALAESEARVRELEAKGAPQ